MYERNAIVIDRYFANIYGYEDNNNIKNNSNNYFELVDALEKYQEASEIENNIMMEYDKIAGQIKDTKRAQETLNKKNRKLIEARENLFENLDEDSETLSKQFKKIDEEIEKSNEEIKANSERFVAEIKEFQEKSETRSICGKERRIIESDYQKKLKATEDNFNNITKEKLKEIKSFVKLENKGEAKEQIREKIVKNGAKEKVPFDQNVVNAAIDVSTDIEGKKAEVLMSLYDKTMRLLDEIRNDAVKMEKHKKIVLDSKSKLEFLNGISDYIILFLDNERMNCLGGQEEHEKNMLEACEHLQEDLIEIQKMYSLLVKEITGKASHKAYKELYNLDYLKNLQEEEKRFEKSISKLNMVGTVFYPDYWRIEGMEKIYSTFQHILTDSYGKDLTQYEPLDITFDVKEEELKDDVEEENEEVKEGQKDESQDENGNKDAKSTSEEDELKEDLLKEDDDDDEFHWDDEDEEDELNFGTGYTFNHGANKEKQDDFEEELILEEEREIEESEEESEIDKEIDKALGFFDEEEKEDSDDIEDKEDNEENEDNEEHINEEDNEKNQEDEEDDDENIDDIFDVDDEEIDSVLPGVEEKNEEDDEKTKDIEEETEEKEDIQKDNIDELFGDESEENDFVEPSIESSDDDEDLLTDDIFDDIEEKEEKPKREERRKSIFGRRRNKK